MEVMTHTNDMHRNALQMIYLPSRNKDKKMIFKFYANVLGNDDVFGALLFAPLTQVDFWKKGGGEEDGRGGGVSPFSIPGCGSPLLLFPPGNCVLWLRDGGGRGRKSSSFSRGTEVRASQQDILEPSCDKGKKSGVPFPKPSFQSFVCVCAGAAAGGKRFGR